MPEEYKEWWKNPVIYNYLKPAEQADTSPQAQPIGGNGGYGYTGKGPDGVGRPDRRVPGMGNGSYDVHEQEYVLNADATQAIGPDVLDSIQAEVKAGRPINVNKIREAIGGNSMDGYKCGGRTKPGYQEGGRTPTATATAIPERGAQSGNARAAAPTSTTPIPDPLGKKEQKIDPIAVTPGGGPQNFNIEQPIKVEPTQPITPIAGPTVKPEAIGQLPTVKPDAIGEIPTVKPDAIGEIPTVKPDAIGETPPTVKPDAIGQLPTVKPDAIGEVPGPVDPDKIKDYQGIGGNIGSGQKPIQDMTPEEFMKQIMMGNNPYLQQLKQMYSQDMAGAGAASMAAMRQMAAQSGMTPEQIASMAATFGRDTTQAVSKLLGTLALKGTEMQYQAAKDAFNMNMQNKQFEFAKQKYGDQESNRILQDINGGMSYDMIRKKYPHLNITKEDYESMRSMSQMGWQQEVFNQQMDWAKKQYGDLEGQRIANDINNGMTLKQIQEKYPDANVTQEDYDQMQQFSQMGFQHDQWNYKKKVDAFNQLMQQGGEENYQNAAKLFNSMFGTNVDFSNALTEENKQNFNEAWNNMTGSIAGGMTFEDWKKSAIADGTYDNLNMTDSDIQTMYENMQLQNNPTYQALTQYDRMLQKGILSQEEYDRVTRALKYGITHPEGFVFSDGFQVNDENGNEVGFFKSQEEADEFINDNPDKGYTSKTIKEGWVEYGGGNQGTGPDNNISSTIDYLDSIGVTETDESRIQQFLDEHGGELPEGLTKKQWDDWNQNTGSYSRINEYFSGTGFENLTPADNKMLESIREAQDRVDNGKGTKEDEELLGKLNFQLSGKPPLDFENPTYGDSGDIQFAGTGEGVVHMNYKYPTDIYNASYNKNQAQKKKAFPMLRLKPEMKDYFEKNKGRKFEYDGKIYEIQGVEERSIYTDSLLGKSWKAETVKVIGPDGKVDYLDFGASGSITD